MSEIDRILADIEAEGTERVERFRLVGELEAHTDRSALVTAAGTGPAALAEAFSWHVEQVQAQFEAVAASIAFDLNTLQRLAAEIRDLR